MLQNQERYDLTLFCSGSLMHIRVLKEAKINSLDSLFPKPMEYYYMDQKLNKSFTFIMHNITCGSAIMVIDPTKEDSSKSLISKQIPDVISPKNFNFYALTQARIQDYRMNRFENLSSKKLCRIEQKLLRSSIEDKFMDKPHKTIIPKEPKQPSTAPLPKLW